MRKHDPWIDRYLDFLRDELIRLDGGQVGWFYWKLALVHFVMRRRIPAWEAINKACQWLAQIERGVE